MAGRDLGLDRVRAAAEVLGPTQRIEPAADQQPVPESAVLVGQQHRLPVRVDPGRDAGGLELHQREQPVHLGLAIQQPGQQATEPESVHTQRRTEPVVPPAGRVPLVEDQIDDAEHRTEPFRKLLVGRQREPYAGAGQVLLGPGDPLSHARLRRQERPGDLVGAQAGDGPQGQGHLRFRRVHRVAGGEQQAQQVVGDPRGQRLVHGSHRVVHLLPFRGDAQFRSLAW